MLMQKLSQLWKKESAAKQDDNQRGYRVKNLSSAAVRLFSDLGGPLARIDPLETKVLGSFLVGRPTKLFFYSLEGSIIKTVHLSWQGLSLLSEAELELDEMQVNGCRAVKFLQAFFRLYVHKKRAKAARKIQRVFRQYFEQRNYVVTILQRHVRGYLARSVAPCELCMATFAKGLLVRMSKRCKHMVCRECISTHVLQVKRRNGTRPVLPCPGAKCLEAMSQKALLAVINAASAMEFLESYDAAMDEMKRKVVDQVEKQGLTPNAMEEFKLVRGWEAAMLTKVRATVFNVSSECFPYASLEVENRSSHEVSMVWNSNKRVVAQIAPGHTSQSIVKDMRFEDFLVVETNTNKLVGRFPLTQAVGQVVITDALFKSTDPLEEMISIRAATIVQAWTRRFLCMRKRTCQVCLNDTLFDGVMVRTTSKAGCDHKVCGPCMRLYLRTKLEEGRLQIKCLMHKCNSLVPDTAVVGILGGVSLEELRNRRRQQHEGYLREILNENNEDMTEFKTWLQKEARVCPSCKVLIHRSEGCNHMHCPCGRHFDYHHERWTPNLTTYTD